ncbi:NAD(P)/FAD-dependent oxidoreductase [Nioella ostreopsis]|uniref:NAD(P)/FAD-dependent oxidoreductase n=1 Tax=Nioella ostreopsis TaxID=2448479 RepID=UPI000FD82F67|nr:FAD-binding oxidoreductase [Nioella ostreopsis]
MSSHHARRLPVHKGPAAWSAILPGQPAPVPLSDNITADVAVVGAGFAGLSAARRLLQLDPTLKVVVLDAGRVAEGAAGRNSGFMIDLPHDLASDDYAGSGDDRAVIALNRQAIAFALSAAEEYGIPRDFADPVGKVNGAASAAGHAHNESYAKHLSTLGEASEMLDAKAMEELTGSAYYLSGLYTPGTVMLQPAGYIRGLAEGLKAKAAIHENSPVTGIARIGNDWHVGTAHGSVTAPRVIMANNGQLESFGFARNRLMHIFLYASMTPVLPEGAVKGADRWGVTPSDPMGTTMRKISGAQGGSRIITRTAASFKPGMVASDAAMRRARRIHDQKFGNRFPDLRGLEMEFTWAGHLCLSRNSVSVTGELEEGLYAACCQNGLGTARGTLTGMGAAEMAMEVDSDITRALRAEPDPTRLPPRPLSDIGANVFLRWKEWRAGAE